MVLPPHNVVRDRCEKHHLEIPEAIGDIFCNKSFSRDERQERKTQEKRHGTCTVLSFSLYVVAKTKDELREKTLHGSDTLYDVIIGASHSVKFAYSDV